MTETDIYVAVMRDHFGPLSDHGRKVRRQNQEWIVIEDGEEIAAVPTQREALAEAYRRIASEHLFEVKCLLAEARQAEGDSDQCGGVALAQLRECLTERLQDERSQHGEMHTWRASAFGDAIAEILRLTQQSSVGQEGEVEEGADRRG